MSLLYASLDTSVESLYDCVGGLPSAANENTGEAELIPVPTVIEPAREPPGETVVEVETEISTEDSQIDIEQQQSTARADLLGMCKVFFNVLIISINIWYYIGYDVQEVHTNSV